MAKGEESKTVLILDDEPEYLTWVADFLQSEGMTVEFVRTLPEALAALARREYRLFLVDMNVPPLTSLDPAIQERVPLVNKYPGLAFAIRARTQGYGAHSVIAYTVHDDDAADKELEKLRCRYVLKGRPQDLKIAIRSALAPPRA